MGVSSGSLLKRKKLSNIVVKIGSSTFTEGGVVRQEWLNSFAADIAVLVEKGVRVTIICSGAVALGKKLLKHYDPTNVHSKQLAASLGQHKILRAYEDALSGYGLNPGQGLVNNQISTDEEIRNNFVGMMHLSFAEGNVVQILNENDSIHTEELKIGNNDHLAGHVVEVLNNGIEKVDCLFLMTDTEGLYTDNPRTNVDAKLIGTVSRISKEMEAGAAGGAGSVVGTGGMGTKLETAKKCSELGVSTVIANGGAMHPISRLFEEDAAYTYVYSRDERIVEAQEKIRRMVALRKQRDGKEACR